VRIPTGIAALLLGVMATPVFGGPNTVMYQGGVAGPNGTPVADGNYSMRFSIFTVASGGANVWQETDANVAVKTGQFSATLGDGTAFGALFANSNDLWLEIEIDLNHSGVFDAGEKYSPRSKLAGAPWAMEADTLDKRHATEFSLATHNHDAAYWRLAGNAGTTSGTHFLGTTDNKPLDLRVNNVRALRIQPGGLSSNVAPNLIGGWRGNTVTSGVVGATIAGGGWSAGANRVGSSFGTIAGGRNNAIVSGVSIIGGGESNSVGGNWSTLGGGFNNAITSYSATIGGGLQNLATGPQSTIAGGEHNKAGGYSSSVGGGRINRASGHYATIAGGDTNTAGGHTATICGGWTNVASGTLATVAGGAENSAAGKYSFAAGHMAEANHEGTFVWGDSFSWPSAKSTGNNQFIVRAGGGMMLTPNSGPLQPNAQLHIAYDSNLGRPHLLLEETQAGDFARLRFVAPILGPVFWDVAASGEQFNIYYGFSGQNILQLLPTDPNDLLKMSNGAHLTKGGAWSNGSDRATKSNFAAVDSRDVLEQVAALPIQTWNYRSEPETSRHMGPMAQDFYAAFSLGDSDRSISTVDADGVALAAIQGLYRMVQEKSAEMAALKADKETQIAAQQQQIAAQQAQIGDLTRRLAAVESLLTGSNPNRRGE
jgi:hypothetical protein